MAYSFWRGPGARNAPIEGGIYEDGLNWTRGDPPGADDIAELPTGDYTVTLASDATIGELRIGQGATFLFDGGISDRLTLVNTAVNSGTLRLEGGVVVLQSSFVNYGTIAGQSASSDDYLFGGTVVNHGLVTLIEREYLISSTFDNASDGIVRADRDYGLTFFGIVTNAGLFEADGSGLYLSDFRGTAALTNLPRTILTGGQWHVANGGTIRLVGQAIEGLGGGAEVVLDGRGTTLDVDTAAGLQSLDASLRRIEAGAELHLLGRRGFGAGQALDLRGELELRGGTLDAGVLNAGAESTIIGFGTVAGEGDLDGAVRIKGTLRFTGEVIVGGTISGGTLALDGRDNRIEADAHVRVRTLALGGGVTRVEPGDFRARNLSLNDAIVDFQEADFVLRGALDLDGGRVNGSGTLRLGSGDLTSSGMSAFGLDVLNTGTVVVESGSLTFERGLLGAGSVAVGDGATLAFGASASAGRLQHVELNGAATLSIAAPARFAGLLSGFGEGDTIAVRGFSAATARALWAADADGAGGTLKVTGEGAAAVLHFDDGAYTRRNFALADVDGALAVTYRGRALDMAVVFGADTAFHPPAHSALDGVLLHTDGHVALV